MDVEKLSDEKLAKARRDARVALATVPFYEKARAFARLTQVDGEYLRRAQLANPRVAGEAPPWPREYTSPDLESPRLAGLRGELAVLQGEYAAPIQAQDDELAAAFAISRAQPATARLRSEQAQAETERLTAELAAKAAPIHGAMVAERRRVAEAFAATVAPDLRAAEARVVYLMLELVAARQEEWHLRSTVAGLPESAAYFDMPHEVAADTVLGDKLREALRSPTNRNVTELRARAVSLGLMDGRDR